MALIHEYFVDIFVHRKLLHESAKMSTKYFGINDIVMSEIRTSICHVTLSFTYKEKEASISFHLSSSEVKFSLLAIL